MKGRNVMLGEIKKIIKRSLVKKDVFVETIPLLEGELLKEKVALVTGGGTGIGYGIAEAFNRQGAKVILTGRNEDQLKKSCYQLKKGSSQYIVWDVADIQSIQEKLEYAVQLVNNAGYHGNQNFFTVTEEDYDNTFDVNIKGLFFMCQAVSAYMKENGIEGHILNISSASSMKPAWSPYEISKWACRGFTRGLAREVAPYGIVVNGIAPGPTATRMSFWNDGDSITRENLPLGRLVMPSEIGNMAAYLCSDLGKCMMGETIFVDGGSGMLTSNK